MLALRVFSPPSAASCWSAYSGNIPRTRYTSAVVAKSSAITPRVLPRQVIRCAKAIKGVRVTPEYTSSSLMSRSASPMEIGVGTPPSKHNTSVVVLPISSRIPYSKCWAAQAAEASQLAEAMSASYPSSPFKEMNPCFAQNTRTGTSPAKPAKVCIKACTPAIRSVKRSTISPLIVTAC